MIKLKLSAEQLEKPGVAESFASLMLALGGEAPRVQRVVQEARQVSKKAVAQEVQPLLEATIASPPVAPIAPEAPAPKKRGRPKKDPNAPSAPPKSAAAQEEAIVDLEGLMGAVSDNSRTFLEILQNRKQLTMKEAMAMLGLGEKKAVGGVVGGISRKAQKHGLFPPFRSGKTDTNDRLWKWTGDVHNEPKVLPSKQKKRGRKPKKPRTA